MMDLPLVSLPDLPMATRKPTAKKTVTKKTAKRTLDDVKNVTHTKPSRMTTKAEPAIGRIPEHILLGPGDYPERKSYFDYDDSQRAGTVSASAPRMARVSTTRGAATAC